MSDIQLALFYECIEFIFSPQMLQINADGEEGIIGE